jgi:hypothetical protein
VAGGQVDPIGALLLAPLLELDPLEPRPREAFGGGLLVASRWIARAFAGACARNSAARVRPVRLRVDRVS